MTVVRVIRDSLIFMSLLAGFVANGVAVGPAGAETVIVREDGSGVAARERRPFVLTDSFGRAVTDQDLLGSYVLLFFGYTFCPDVCPTSLQTMSLVLDELGDDAGKVKPVFISVDPKRDTPKVIGEYADAFDERIIALTGPQPFIDAVVAAYNAKVEIVDTNPDDPNDYHVDHTASIALVGPDGKLITRFGHGMGAAEITKRLRGIMTSAATQ